MQQKNKNIFGNVKNIFCNFVIYCIIILTNFFKSMNKKYFDSEITDIEVSKVTKEVKDGKIETIIPYFPLRDRVVVKTIFYKNVFDSFDPKEIVKSAPKKVMVVAKGEAVPILQIGDYVDLTFNATVDPIPFKENNKSVKVVTEIVKEYLNKFRDTLTPADKLQPIKIIEYFSVPYYSIVGIRGDVK
jgi:hypothetical protein